jgi:hypothetical protein
MERIIKIGRSEEQNCQVPDLIQNDYGETQLLCAGKRIILVASIAANGWHVQPMIIIPRKAGCQF